MQPHVFVTAVTNIFPAISYSGRHIGAIAKG
jgi:hypothetical protein